MFIVYFYITPTIIALILWNILIQIEGPKPEYVKDLFHPVCFIPTINLLILIILPFIGIVFLIKKIGDIKLRVEAY